MWHHFQMENFGYDENYIGPIYCFLILQKYNTFKILMMCGRATSLDVYRPKNVSHVSTRYRK